MDPQSIVMLIYINPCGSIHHCHYHSQLVHRNLTQSPNLLIHSNLLPPHCYHSIPSISSLQNSFNSWSNSYSQQPLAPVNIIQTIQHPRGISPTKLKITKTNPEQPSITWESIEQFYMAHWTCGNIIPPHRQDQDSWRSMDMSRRTFERGFESMFGRRSSRRFGD